MGSRAAKCFSSYIRDHSFKIFQKPYISYPPIRTRMCEYQGLRNVVFPKKFSYVPGFIPENKSMREVLRKKSNKVQ